MSRQLSVFLVAGEPSGDVLGGRLIAALRELTGDRIVFAGIGGEMMEAQGLESLFPMEELSVMGIAEILPHLPRLLHRIRQTSEEIDRVRPDALITIDSPDFARRVARRVSDRSFPRIHYVAPSVWAWRPWRARGFARDFTHLLALLPFEPPWFEAAGLPCRFVGHPVIEGGAEAGDGAAFRKRYGIAPESPVVCVLPGSRRGEIARLAGDFGLALTQLASRYPGLRPVVPTISTLVPTVRELSANWPGPAVVVTGGTERHDAMAAANVALAASGTVTLELALSQVPTVVAYRMAPLTYFLVRRFVTVDYASLVNIIEGREIMPELIQEECRPDRLADALVELMGPAGEAQVEAVRPALAQLGLGGEAPSRRAAQAVLDITGFAGS